MSSTISESGADLRIEPETGGRELIARPFGPSFRLVSVVGDCGTAGADARHELRYATHDLDVAAVDALLARLTAWRAEHSA